MAHQTFRRFVKYVCTYSKRASFDGVLPSRGSRVAFIRLPLAQLANIYRTVESGVASGKSVEQRDIAHQLCLDDTTRLSCIMMLYPKR